MTLRTLSILRGAAVVLALLCASPVLDAQVLYGSLTGNVTDPSEAGVPSAKVEALNTGTGVSRQASTDERGLYLFGNLQLGTYKITVSMTSFKTVIQDNVQVNANEVRRVDFHLQIAQTTETVEITAASTTLQTDKSDVHQEIFCLGSGRDSVQRRPGQEFPEPPLFDTGCRNSLCPGSQL